MTGACSGARAVVVGAVGAGAIGSSGAVGVVASGGVGAVTGVVAVGDGGGRLGDRAKGAGIGAGVATLCSSADAETCGVRLLDSRVGSDDSPLGCSLCDVSRLYDDSPRADVRGNTVEPQDVCTSLGPSSGRDCAGLAASLKTGSGANGNGGVSASLDRVGSVGVGATMVDMCLVMRSR